MTEPDLFPVLEPPPGGLPRLRARISSRGQRRGLAVAMVVAAAAVVLVWVGEREPEGGAQVVTTTDAASVLLDGVEHPALVSWGRAAAPSEPVVVLAGASVATRIATSSDGVVMYRVDFAVGAQPVGGVGAE